MSTWATNGVDFRSLISFKNQLFDSPALNNENCIPMDEYKRIRNSHEDAKIQAEVGGTDHMIFKAMGVDPVTNLIDMNIFADLVDVYIYYPVKEAVKSQ